MKVVICIGRLYMGGIEKYAIDLAMGLRDKGHNVSMLVFFSVKNEEKRLFLHNSGIEIHELKCKSGRDVKLPFLFFKRIRKVKPDLIHFNILPMLAVIPLLFVKAKTVFTIHQMKLNSIISRIYENYINGIIAVSNAVFELNSQKLNYFKNSVWNVIYHGVLQLNTTAKYNKGDNVELIMVSRLAQDKNPDHAIYIINYLKNYSSISFRLRFIGAGDVDDDEYIEKIHRNITANKLNDFVQFEGWQEDVYCYIADSHGMLILSESESFGYSAMEAMAHGVPIFSYKIEGGLHEFHKGNQTGIVSETRDPIELAKEIDKVFSNKDLWSKYSNNAFAKSKDFSIQQMVDKTEDFYQQLINKKKWGHD